MRLALIMAFCCAAGCAAQQNANTETEAQEEDPIAVLALPQGGGGTAIVVVEPDSPQTKKPMENEQKPQEATPKKEPKTAKETFAPSFAPGPHVKVYKTKSDYNDLVPVTLSEDGNSLVSYPHQSDLMRGGELRTPTKLKKGYLLDNRGIGPQTAFLDMTYRSFTVQKASPDAERIMKLIKEKNPMLELYDCGLESSYTDKISQLNQLIEDGDLNTVCKKIN